MQFDRFISLIGINNFNKIQSKNILVIGLGGVGSYVVESLVRSGILNITIADYDVIDITNLNRQIMTNLNNIGNKKTDEIEKRILSINNKVKVTKIDEFIDSSNINIINNNYDYVVDCSDTFNTKCEIIKNCLDKKIKFITSMGTAKKMDPSKLEIIDIRKTSYDPLAKKIRKWVKDNRIKGKIMTISSSEVPFKMDNNILGSTSFVPSSAGLLITSYIINDIINNK